MKRILGLDLGTNSIGWALVQEAENQNEQSKIIKLGVRVTPLTADEKKDFEKGNPLSVNANRTLKRGARRNLQRFKLRRKYLINILKKNHIITDTTLLTEIGKDSTYQTLSLRAKAATEQIDLKDFAKVFLTLNKKRGYKSSRKSIDENDGIAIDRMSVAKILCDNNSTPGQYVYGLLLKGEKFIPDFYRSDLQKEMDLIWEKQKVFYSEILSDELYRSIQGKNKGTTWAICQRPFDIKGIKLEGKKPEQKLKRYELRALGVSDKLDLEHLAIVLQEINNDLTKSSDYLGKISDRSKELFFKKITVGQYLFNQIKQNPNSSLKNRVFYRQDYLDEFEQIWEKQAKYYPVLTTGLKEEIRDTIIFYQRRLKSQKALISFCQFESWQEDKKDEKGNVIMNKSTGLPKKRMVGQKVIPKSSPLFQEFKIWQNLNNLEFKNVSANSLDIKRPENSFNLDEVNRQLLFEELNLRGDLTSNQVLCFLGKNPKDWKCNYEKIEGNRTNQALFDVYQKIAEAEGYGFDWAKKSVTEIKTELKEIFAEIGIKRSILDFDPNKEGNDYDNQDSYQFWHILYSAEDDHKIAKEDQLIYGNSNVAVRKKLHLKYGFKPEYTKWLTNIRLQQDYGSLSSRAIRKILPFLEKGHDYYESSALAGYNSSKSFTKEELAIRVLKDKLELLPKNNLRNPVVEKILNQMVNLVNQIIDLYGKPDEIRIELARELKKSASERKDTTSFITKRTKENNDLKNLITKEFGIPNPTKNDVIRYRLYEELLPLGHKTIFTNTYIPKEKLFSKEIDIEHIIPKALSFDDSFSNKTLAYRETNLKKRDRTGLDFIKSDYQEGLNGYKTRVNSLYNNGKGTIGKNKCKKFLMRQEDLKDDFIERDLRNSQYIAKKAAAMLFEIAPMVVRTSGRITSKLREDWGLINVMKELNLPKYKNLELTEIQERKNGKKIEVIKDWTKRNDHRHHAIDALTVAFTSHNHIQYLNNLNARKDEDHEKHTNIIAIEKKITFKDEDGKKKFIPPINQFRRQAKDHIESILVSFKAKNKVSTTNLNKTKKEGGWNLQKTKTPRGQLHKETIYGRSKQPMLKPLKLSTRLSKNEIDNIIHPEINKIVKIHLAKYANDITLAFKAKTLKGDPVLFKNEIVKEVLCYEEVYTIRKEINPSNFNNTKSLEKIIDPRIRELLRNRLNDDNSDAKQAFSDLEKKPIWINENKGLSVKRVTISGVSSVEALHEKKDHLGNVLLDGNQKTLPNDFVSTGNNHHVAIYRDEKGKLQEKVVSFYEAVERVNQGLSVIDKSYNHRIGWQFLFSLKQNEMFVFPGTNFNPSEIDLLNNINKKQISKYLFRVQKIGSKDYWFRHHLETVVTNDQEFTYKRIRNANYLENVFKVRMDHLGRIVHLGEY